MATRGGERDYEFQRLHGMGVALYKAAGRERSVRIYAPVGAHQDLLALSRAPSAGERQPTRRSCTPSSTRTCRPSASPPIPTRCCRPRPRAIRAFPPPPALYGAVARELAWPRLQPEGSARAHRRCRRRRSMQGRADRGRPDRGGQDRPRRRAKMPRRLRTGRARRRARRFGDRCRHRRGLRQRAGLPAALERRSAAPSAPTFSKPWPTPWSRTRIA